MLLRHWTLEDSISNSSYMVTKLQLYKEEGQIKLKKLFVKIGIPLDQAKQKFMFMEPTLRKELKVKIMDVSHDMGFDKILIDSYCR